jgi:hypothetical protein
VPLPGVPPALAEAGTAWDTTETGTHAAALAVALCEAAPVPRCPGCQQYRGTSHLCRDTAPPKLTSAAKKHAQKAEALIAQAPSLIDLANGAHAYGAGPDSQAEATALASAQTIGRSKTAPPALVAARRQYELSPQAHAPAFAAALCTLAGVQQCQLCGQFRSTLHLCPVAQPALPATQIGPQRRASFQTPGTALTGAKFTAAEHTSYGTRKGDVTAWGQTVTHWSRQHTPAKWSSARTQGIAPPKPDGGALHIGNSLPWAIALLERATVVETADGYVQLYDAAADQILSVYDPRDNVVGSPGRRATEPTAEELAAVLAYRLRHPENALDEALMTDVQMLRIGRGSLSAVIDSAELVIRENVTRAQPLQVGCGLTVPRCQDCGQWMGDAHTCPVTTPAAARTRRLEDTVGSLEPGEEVINNQHLAKLYSSIATSMAGAPRRVIFGQPGSGFATDMQGKIYADPQPLGPTAPLRHQLVVIKQGIYHELGHEECTPGAMWRRLLDLAKAPGPVEVEVDPDLAALPSQAALTTRTVPPTDPAAGTAPAVLTTLDAGRHILPKIYNIIEDGGMERLIAARYAGAAEALAAGAAIYPRWHEQVGPGVPLVEEVIWPLLYTALPYFRVRDEVRAQMTPTGRAIFEELEPIVAHAVRGTPEDRFWATIEVTRRLEAYGLLQIPDAVASPPPPPLPGTAPFRGRPQQGGGGSQGQSDQGGSAGGGGGPAQPGQAGGGSGGGHGPEADPEDARRGRGRRRGRTAEEDARIGRRRASGGADDDVPAGRKPGQTDDDAGGAGGGAATDDESAGDTGGGGAADDAPAGRQPGQEDDDEADGAGAAATGDADAGRDGDADAWGGMTLLPRMTTTGTGTGMRTTMPAIRPRLVPALARDRRAAPAVIRTRCAIPIARSRRARSRIFWTGWIGRRRRQSMPACGHQPGWKA